MLIALKVFLILLLILLYYLNSLWRKSNNKKLYILITTLVDQQNYKEALQIYDKKLKKFKKDRSYYLLQMHYFYSIGELDSLITLIRTKLKTETPRLHLPLNYEKKALYLTNAIEEADRELIEYDALLNEDKNIEEKPQMVFALNKFHHGEYGESKFGLEKSLSVTGNTADKIICYIYLARIYKIESNIEKMEECITKAKLKAKGILYNQYIEKEFGREDNRTDD